MFVALMRSAYFRVFQDDGPLMAIALAVGEQPAPTVHHLSPPCSMARLSTLRLLQCSQLRNTAEEMSAVLLVFATRVFATR